MIGDPFVVYIKLKAINLVVLKIVNAWLIKGNYGRLAMVQETAILRITLKSIVFGFILQTSKYT